ncbi:hypothetical protein Tco_0023725, partial [Tanacetum coccineum]
MSMTMMKLLFLLGILQLVLLGVDDRRRVPDGILRLANDRVAWDKYPWGSREEALIRKRIRSLDLLGHSRRYPRVVAWSSKRRFYRHMVKGFFHGRLPIERLTPDDNEARSEWWVSSKAYFDGVISVAERIPRHLNQQNVYEVPSEFYRDFEEQKRAVEEMMKKDAERQETYDQ